MDWEAIGAIGELLGALGVIVSLIYLAAQIRHNTKVVGASTFQANAELWQTWYIGVAGSDVAQAYSHGMAGRDDIDPQSFHRFFLVCRALFLNLENQYYQYRQGALDEATFSGYEPVTRATALAWPGIRAWWELNRDGYGPEFVAYIDRQIAETTAMAETRASNPQELLDAWRAALMRQSPAPDRSV